VAIAPIQYDLDHTTFTGYLANDSPGVQQPGILIAHEAPGMSDLIKQRAQVLARLGYVAFALDLHGATGFSLEESRARHAHLMSTPGLIFRRAAAALEVLGNQPDVDLSRLGAIGFCQGGITVLELARGGLPIRCAVGFHPGLKRPAGSPNGPIAAKVLMMVGDADPVVPPADRAAFIAEMNAAEADWELHLFGGIGHAFTDPRIDSLGIPGFTYSEAASRRSWNRMLDLLQETFGPSATA
jgi:dienelactone hydrolase